MGTVKICHKTTRQWIVIYWVTWNQAAKRGSTVFSETYTVDLVNKTVMWIGQKKGGAKRKTNQDSSIIYKAKLLI